MFFGHKHFTASTVLSLHNDRSITGLAQNCTSLIDAARRSKCGKRHVDSRRRRLDTNRLVRRAKYCEHIAARIECLHFTKLPVHVACGHGSVILRPHSDMLRTSGFVDDVMFNYDGPYAGMSIALQPRCCHVRRAQVNAPAAWCRSHRILNHVLKGQSVKITKKRRNTYTEIHASDYQTKYYFRIVYSKRLTHG